MMNLNLFEQAPCTLPPVNSPNQKTVILDLDHTLICSLFCPSIQPLGSFAGFLVKWDNESAWYVKKRPYVDDFLRYLSQNNFEIVVFTAGAEGYASPILDKLDPEGLISHRFYAQSCKIHCGWPVKDLSDLGRDLKNVVIIDDQPVSYRLQPENGLPIKKFLGDRQDLELKKLMDEFFDKCEQHKYLKDALKHFIWESRTRNRRGRLQTRF